MKDTRFHGWVVLLVAALVLSVVPAVAAPLAQEGREMVDFEKPDWGMTMKYPFDWGAEDLGDLVRFTAEDYSTFAVLEDEAFLDMKGSLAGKTQVALNKLGVDSFGLRVIPQKGTTKRREALISGMEAIYFVGWMGYIIQFVLGDRGYLVFCSSVTDVFQERQTVFSAMAESIKFEGLETPTPTREAPPTFTPTRTRSAGPTPSPTPRSRVTPQARTSPVVEAGLTTAREAYDLARPAAEAWSAQAFPDRVTCTAPYAWQGSDAGRCRCWEVTFLKSLAAGDIPIAQVGPETEANAYNVVVNDGAVNDDESEKWVVSKQGMFGPPSGSAGREWVDSADAVGAFAEAGGSAFVLNHSGQLSGTLGLHRPVWNGPVLWSVSAVDKSVPGEELSFQVDVDAATGSADMAEEPPAVPGSPLSLREAVALAQPEVSKWRPNVQLTEATARMGANDPGADEGKAARWQLTYMAKPQPPQDMPDFKAFDVVDGKVEPGRNESGSWHGIALPAEWLDSSEVWDKLRATDDYRSLVNLNTNAVGSMTLQGDWRDAYVWTAGLEAGAVHLTLELKLPVPTATTTPAPGVTPTKTARPAPTPTSESTAELGPTTEALGQRAGKPDWNLTFPVPAHWTVYDWGETLEITLDVTGQFAQVLIISDAKYGGPDYNLDEVLGDMVDRSLLVVPSKPEPAEARRIAGQEAEAATFEGVDIVGDPVSGRLYRLSVGDQTFAVWTVAADNNTERYDADFDLMLDGLQVGGGPAPTEAAPTATPTRTPRTRAPRPAPGTPNATGTAVTGSTPVLKFFYTDACSGCKTMRPTIDELKAQYAGRIAFVYVNVADPDGKQAAAPYSVRVLPDVILLKASGEIVQRWIGQQDPMVFQKAFDALLAAP